MMSNTEFTLYEINDGAAWITLNKPENRNALSAVLVNELYAHLQNAITDDKVRCIVITGNGPAFCAGADLKQGADAYYAGSRPDLEERAEFRFDETECPKPIIAAIDGYALGGGLELSLRCDIRIATEASTFGLPEVRRGRTSGTGVVMLSRMIPLGEAKWMQFTGSHMSAQRAYAIGLLQSITPAREALVVEEEKKIAAENQGSKS